MQNITDSAERRAIRSGRALRLHLACSTLLAAGCATSSPPPASTTQLAPAAVPAAAATAPATAPAWVPGDGPSILVDEGVPTDPALEQLLTPYRVEVEERMRRVIGRASQPIAPARPEGALGNMMVDAMRAAAEDAIGQPVDLAFTNAGGIRNAIPAGEVTIGAMFEVMPFDNTIVVFELPGEALARLLDTAAARGGDPVSGARYVIQDERAVEVLIGGRTLDPAASYRVATNDYVFDGGSRFAGLDAARREVRTGVLVRDALIAAVEAAAARGELRAETDGRVRVAPRGGS